MTIDLHPVLADLVERLRRRRSGELAVGGMSLGGADPMMSDVERLRLHLYRHYYLSGGRPARANAEPLSMWRSSRGRAPYTDARETAMPVRLLEKGASRALVLEPGSGLRLRVATSELRSVGGVTTAPLAAIRPHLSPGFTVFDAAEPMSGQGSLWRFYFNADPSMMRPLVEALSAALEGCPPHRFKAYVGSEARADSVVLYVSADHYLPVRRALKQAGILKHEALRDWTPLFTRAIAPGVAVAEDPGGSLSFGEDRCERLARALLTVLAARTRLTRDDLPTLVEELSATGLDLARPHRSARDPRADGRLRTPRATPSPSLSAEEALERCVAAVLESAIATGGRLTWLSRAGGGPDALSAARPDVYSGAAGIGWFLAEAAAWRGLDRDGVAERVCSEAVEAAVGLEPETFYSLFSGPLGTALAVHRAAECLKSVSLDDRARALAKATVASLPAPSSAAATDWLGGLAGAAAGLIQVWRIWGLEEAREATASIADEIARRARHRSGSSAWPLPQAPRLRPLTGFSHGAGGIGLSLLIVGLELDRADLLELARRAFAYENAWYSRAHKAWPDLRPGQAGFPKAWCHGSPGILLSHCFAHRLAADVAPWDDRHLSATEAMLLSNSASTCSGAEPCLCHGYVGNLEIAALLAERGFGPPPVIPSHLAWQLTKDIASAGRGSSPALRDSSLMLGASGIGMFILRRMLDAQAPSPLMLGVTDLTSNAAIRQDAAFAVER